MVVLRAIGRFFARIGRWIRDTAWVQPLLIVGGIFAIIFSIPKITEGIQGWFKGGNAAESFYNNFKLSMDNIENGKSKVDELFSYLDAKESGDSAKAAEVSKGERTFGTKFFIAFVQKDCSDCEANYKTFEEAKIHWRDSLLQELPSEDKAKMGDFRLHTIFVDQTVSETDDTLLFQKYVLDGEYAHIFEEAASLKTAYRENSGEDEKFEKINGGDDGKKFTTPTTFLIDFDHVNPETGNKNPYGISEIFFSNKARKDVTTSTDFDKARGLVDSWLHQGLFAKDYK